MLITAMLAVVVTRAMSGSLLVGFRIRNTPCRFSLVSITYRAWFAALVLCDALIVFDPAGAVAALRAFKYDHRP